MYVIHSSLFFTLSVILFILFVVKILPRFKELRHIDLIFYKPVADFRDNDEIITSISKIKSLQHLGRSGVKDKGEGEGERVK